MIFGEIAIEDAEGAILAHAQGTGEARIAKGTRLSADHVARLSAAGVVRIVAARLEPGDLDEDEAAAAIGAAASGGDVAIGPAATGRVNFFARTGGLFLPSQRIVDAVNHVHPGITLATLKGFEPVSARRMIATVKIIPLAVPGRAVDEALKILTDEPAFRVAPYRAQRIALVQTELPGTKKSVLDKTRRVLESRLAASGSQVIAERRVPHRAGPLSDALLAMRDEALDMTVVFGASAVIDAADVIPAGLIAAGGIVQHLGMPVDPGNLLLLGALDGRPVLGAPGCARSPKENGFDWILNRLLCDLVVTPEDILGMGVGGLLMEIPTRPSPRLRPGETA